MLTNNHFFMILGLSRPIVHFTTRNHSSAFITCSLWTYESNDVFFYYRLCLRSIVQNCIVTLPSIVFLSLPICFRLKRRAATSSLLLSPSSLRKRPPSSFRRPSTPTPSRQKTSKPSNISSPAPRTTISTLPSSASTL